MWSQAHSYGLFCNDDDDQDDEDDDGGDYESGVDGDNYDDDDEEDRQHLVRFQFKLCEEQLDPMARSCGKDPNAFLINILWLAMI